MLALTAAVWCMLIPEVRAAAPALPPWRLAREALWMPFADDPFTHALFHFDERAAAKTEIDVEQALEAKPAEALDALTAEPAPGGVETAGPLAHNAARQASLAQKPARLEGDCELVPEGRFGGGLHFKGGDGRLLFAGLRRLEARTLELYLKLDALPKSTAVLIESFATPQAGSAAAPVILQLTPEGAPQLVWRNQPLPPVTYRCEPGKWVHLALAWSSQWPNANQMLLLVNGRVLERESVPNIGPECAHDAFVIGNRLDGTAGIKGVIDEVRLSGTVRQYYDIDLDWPQPDRVVEWRLAPPHARDAADLLFRAGFNKTLTPELAAPGTDAPSQTVTRADEELDAEKVRLHFPAGVEGSGLGTGQGSLMPVYKGAGNLETARGTIAFWLRPVNWDNLTRSSRFGGPGPLAFGLFEIDGEYAAGSYKRTFGQSGPLLEFNIEMRMDEGVDRPVELTPGKWTHVAMTWEGATFTFYVNGKRTDPGGAWRLWLPIYPNEDPGRNAAKPEWWVNAKPEAIRFGDRTYWEQLKIPAPQSVIDDFRVYRRPLAPLEIANLLRLYDPRTKPEPLPPADMETHYNGVSGQITLNVIPLMADYTNAASVAARVTKAGDAKPAGEAKVVFGEQKQAVVEMKTAPLEFATYTITADILNAAGTVLASVPDTFTRTPPPWWGFKGGVSAKVMPEWTPLKVADATVSMWGRDIRFSPLGLPEKVISAGADVLAGPVLMQMQVDGKPATFAGGAGAPRIEAASDVLVTLSGEATAANVRLTTRVSVEFDGMTWFDVTLAPTPGAAPTIDALSIRIPYAAANAAMIHWWSGDRNFRDPKVVHIGDLPAGDGVLFRSSDAAHVVLPKELRGTFIPYVMLTGMQRGMAWFAENDRGWTQSTDVPAVAVERQGGSVTLVLNVLAAAVKLDTPRTFSFGLHPTPVKPLDPEWRRSPSYSNVFPDTFCGNDLKGRPQATSFYVYPEDDWDAVQRRINGEGATKGAAGLKGLYAGELQRLAAAGRTPPLAVETTVPGLYLDMQWNGIPPLAHTREWAESWARDYQSYTPAFIDFASWAWSEWISNTDKFIRGAYLDDCWPCPQTTENSLVTYHLADGHIQPGYQFRGWRERFKRMRQISWDQGLTPHLTSHTTHTFFIPYHSFFDLILDGEDFYSTPPDQSDFIDHWPLDRMRFMHNGKWGQITTWLGWCGGGLKTDKWPAWTFRQSRAYTANLALHDIMWGFDEKVMTAFGLKSPDTVFIPYWDDGGLAQQANPDLKISAWKRAGKCLVLLVNVGKDRLEAKVQLAPAVMGLAAGGTVTVADADPALLTYCADDVTTMKAPPIEKKGDIADDLGTKAAAGSDDLSLEVKDENLPLAERRVKDPDGKFTWKDGILQCPIRRHDFRLFEFRTAP